MAGGRAHEGSRAGVGRCGDGVGWPRLGTAAVLGFFWLYPGAARCGMYIFGTPSSGVSGRSGRPGSPHSHLVLSCHGSWRHWARGRRHRLSGGPHSGLCRRLLCIAGSWGAPAASSRGRESQSECGRRGARRRHPRWSRGRSRSSRGARRGWQRWSRQRLVVMFLFRRGSSGEPVFGCHRNCRPWASC